MSEKRDFDREAARWDEHPARVKLAQAVVDAILRHVSVTRQTDALDFGCGTGLVTLRLQPWVKSITGVDSSEGMLEVLRQKAAAAKLGNVMTQHRDVERGDALAGRYQLVVSSMTLHHIHDVAPLLSALHGGLDPGGTLCIADLDPDGGCFHDDNTGVFHHGFERSALRASFAQTGFKEIRDVTAAEIEKPVSGGGTRRFSIFLMIGKRGD